MKPLKSGNFFANWVIRLSLCLYLLDSHRKIFTAIDFSNYKDWTDLGLFLLACFLLSGGMVKSHTITLLSGWSILLLTLAAAALSFPAPISDFMPRLFPLAASVYFITNGNAR